MKRIQSIFCYLVVLSLALMVDVACAQFGGGGKPDDSETAKKELQAAIDRAESMMGKTPQGEAAAAAPQRSCLCVGETVSPAVVKIKEALGAPLHSDGLDWADTPLQDVIAFLQDDYGISVQLDRPALDEIGLGADEPVTVRIRDTSLESALRLVLNSLQLTYVIRHEVLLITSSQAAESELKTCVYDIRDLVDADQPKGMQALVDAIVSCAARERWASHGGDGEIRPLPPNLLVISQTQSVHEEIRGLLAAVRKMRRRPGSEEAATRAASPEPEPAEAVSH